jgi:hypothetical protein
MSSRSHFSSTRHFLFGHPAEETRVLKLIDFAGSIPMDSKATAKRPSFQFIKQKKSNKNIFVNIISSLISSYQIFINEQI